MLLIAGTIDFTPIPTHHSITRGSHSNALHQCDHKSPLVGPNQCHTQWTPYCMNNASGTTDLITIYTRTAPKSPSRKSRNAHIDQDLSLSNMYIVMRSCASYSKKIGVSLFILIWLSVHESPLHRYPLEADHFGLQVRLFKSPLSSRPLYNASIVWHPQVWLEAQVVLVQWQVIYLGLLHLMLRLWNP